MHESDQYRIKMHEIICKNRISLITACMHDMSDLETGQASVKPARVWYMDLIGTN